jgi:acetate kinase
MPCGSPLPLPSPTFPQLNADLSLFCFPMTKSLNLIINTGSSTYKFDLFEGSDSIGSWLYQKEGVHTFSVVKDGKRTVLGRAGFEFPLRNLLTRKDYYSLTRERSLDCIGFRFVHGGKLFIKPTKVIASVLRRLEKLDDLAPLHNPAARRLVEQAFKQFKKTRMVLFFDTAFHASIPEVNWRYALPRKLSDKFGLRRYGFHGIACSSVVRQLRTMKKLAKRTVICHLGSGCSVTAVLNGRSVDTSMGMTPLEGVVMGTRSGSFDPGMLLYVQKKLRLRPGQLSEMLNFESGLLGLAGTSDMREIQKRRTRDKRLAMAFDLFCKSVADEVASSVTSLGSLDLVVFSGGIGENSSVVRTKVMSYLKGLGKIKILTVHADEAAEMNRFLI